MSGRGGGDGGGSVRLISDASKLTCVVVVPDGTGGRPAASIDAAGGADITAGGGVVFTEMWGGTGEPPG